MSNKNSDSTIDLIHLRVGNEDRPATHEDVEKAKRDLVEVLKENGIDAAVFATHHAADIHVVPGMHMRNGKMLKEGQ